MTRVLYVVQDVNYIGGAHVATANLIRTLREEGCCIDVLTDAQPTEETKVRFGRPQFHFWRFPMHDLAWLVRGISKKLFRAQYYPDWSIDPSGALRRLCLRYDTVCVMSEMDPLRNLVSHLPSRIRKVQMIHTDYVGWRNFSAYARWVTKMDLCSFKRMDAIAVVGEANAESFRTFYPMVSGKVCSFLNVINLSEISKSQLMPQGERFRIVTVARVDEEPKDNTRMVRIAIKLLRDGCPIDWTFYGSGYSKLQERVRAEGLSDCIHFPGVERNIESVLPFFHVMALFSHFEGMPNVVYEAFNAGLPVAATAVGGMRSQIQEGVNGWLFADEEVSLVDGLKKLVQNRDRVQTARNALVGYQYDNQRVLNEHKRLLGFM